jgi:hypothetical protein
MNQFKDVFLGFDKRPCRPRRDGAEVHPRRRQRPRERRPPRATSPSRCSATTSKRDALKFAQSLTEVYKLPADKSTVCRGRGGLRHLEERDRPARRADRASATTRARASLDNF